MATERISQIIPFVKCSDCGANVNLRNLGTHICSSAPPVPSIPIIPLQKQGYQPSQPSPPPQQQPRQPPPSPPRSNYNQPRQDYAPSPYQKAPSPISRPPYSPPPSASDDLYSRSQPNLAAPPPSNASGFGNTYKNAASTSLDSLMADLMDTMNEAIDHYEKPQHSKSPLPPHSPPTQAPPSPNSPRPNPNGCACCQQDFRRHEEPIMFQRRLYHERCFTCTTCNIPLDIRRANEHNDHLYCPRDFASIKKSIRCAHCHDEIEDHVPVVKALGNYYHPGHINCYECHTPLDDRTSFREHQGRVYCKRDYRKMTLPKCRGCGKTVEKEAVSSKELKGKWHVSCFGCQTCHASFPDSTFYIYDSAPYCRRHYHQLNNSLCRSCDGPIEGPCAETSEGWRFHPQCFTCNVCDCALTDIYYMFERKIYCEPHIMDLQRRRKVRAEKRKTHFGNI